MHLPEKEVEDTLSVRPLKPGAYLRLSSPIAIPSSIRPSLFAVSNQFGCAVIAVHSIEDGKHGPALLLVNLKALSATLAKTQDHHNIWFPSKEAQAIIPISSFCNVDSAFLSYLAFAASDRLILAATSDGVISVFSLQTLFSQGQANIAPLRRIFPHATTHVQALVPNPAPGGNLAGSLAVIYGDQTLRVLDLYEAGKVYWTGQSTTAAEWSPMGKRLVIGFTDGKLEYFTLEGQSKGTIEPPPLVQEEGMEVLHIKWVDQKEHIVTYAAKTSKFGDIAPPTETYVLHVTRQTPTPEYTFRQSPDPTPSQGLQDITPNRILTQLPASSLKTWQHLIILSLSNSTELGLIGFNLENQPFRLILREEERIELPTSEEDCDCVAPLGLAATFCSPQSLTIWCYTTDGILAQWKAQLVQPEDQSDLPSWKNLFTTHDSLTADPGINSPPGMSRNSSTSGTPASTTPPVVSLPTAFASQSTSGFSLPSAPSSFGKSPFPQASLVPTPFGQPAFGQPAFGQSAFGQSAPTISNAPPATSTLSAGQGSSFGQVTFGQTTLNNLGKSAFSNLSPSSSVGFASFAAPSLTKTASGVTGQGTTDKPANPGFAQFIGGSTLFQSGTSIPFLPAADTGNIFGDSNTTSSTAAHTKGRTPGAASWGLRGSSNATSNSVAEASMVSPASNAPSKNSLAYGQHRGSPQPAQSPKETPSQIGDTQPPHTIPPVNPFSLSSRPSSSTAAKLPSAHGVPNRSTTLPGPSKALDNLDQPPMNMFAPTAPVSSKSAVRGWGTLPPPPECSDSEDDGETPGNSNANEPETSAISLFGMASSPPAKAKGSAGVNRPSTKLSGFPSSLQPKNEYSNIEKKPVAAPNPPSTKLSGFAGFSQPKSEIRKTEKTLDMVTSESHISSLKGHPPGVPSRAGPLPRKSKADFSPDDKKQMFFTKPATVSVPIRPLDYALVPKILASSDVERMASLAEIGIDGALKHVTDVSDAALRSLKSVSYTCRRFIEECQKPLRPPGSSVDRNTLKQWAMADLPTLCCHVSKLIEQAQEAKSYLDSRFQVARALEGGASKADMKHDEVKRLLRVANDPGYSKVLGSRQLGPLQLARQKNMRRLLQEIRINMNEASVALDSLKSRLSNIKSARRHLQAPYIDTINRSIRHLLHGLSHYTDDLRRLNSRANSLRLPADITGCTHPVAALADLSVSVVRFPEANQAFTESVALQALQNEQSGVQFKEAFLSQRRRPILTCPEESSRVENSALSHILPNEPIILRPRVAPIPKKSASSCLPQSPTWFRNASSLGAPRKSLELAGQACGTYPTKSLAPLSKLKGPPGQGRPLLPPRMDSSKKSTVDNETDTSFAPGCLSDSSSDGDARTDGNAARQTVKSSKTLEAVPPSSRIEPLFPSAPDNSPSDVRQRPAPDNLVRCNVNPVRRLAVGQEISLSVAADAPSDGLSDDQSQVDETAVGLMPEEAQQQHDLKQSSDLTNANRQPPFSTPVGDSVPDEETAKTSKVVESSDFTNVNHLPPFSTPVGDSVPDKEADKASTVVESSDLTDANHQPPFSFSVGECVPDEETGKASKVVESSNLPDANHQPPFSTPVGDSVPDEETAETSKVVESSDNHQPLFSAPVGDSVPDKETVKTSKVVEPTPPPSGIQQLLSGALVNSPPDNLQPNSMSDNLDHAKGPPTTAISARLRPVHEDGGLPVAANASIKGLNDDENQDDKVNADSAPDEPDKHHGLRQSSGFTDAHQQPPLSTSVDDSRPDSDDEIIPAGKIAVETPPVPGNQRPPSSAPVNSSPVQQNSTANNLNHREAMATTATSVRLLLVGQDDSLSVAADTSRDDLNDGESQVDKINADSLPAEPEKRYDQGQSSSLIEAQHQPSFSTPADEPHNDEEQSNEATHSGHDSDKDLASAAGEEMGYLESSGTSRNSSAGDPSTDDEGHEFDETNELQKSTPSTLPDQEQRSANILDDSLPSEQQKTVFNESGDGEGSLSAPPAAEEPTGEAGSVATSSNTSNPDLTHNKLQFDPIREAQPNDKNLAEGCETSRKYCAEPAELSDCTQLKPFDVKEPPTYPPSGLGQANLSHDTDTGEIGSAHPIAANLPLAVEGHTSSEEEQVDELSTTSDNSHHETGQSSLLDHFGHRPTSPSGPGGSQETDQSMVSDKTNDSSSDHDEDEKISEFGGDGQPFESDKDEKLSESGGDRQLSESGRDGSLFKYGENVQLSESDEGDKLSESGRDGQLSEYDGNRQVSESDDGDKLSESGENGQLTESDEDVKLSEPDGDKQISESDEDGSLSESGDGQLSETGKAIGMQAVGLDQQYKPMPSTLPGEKQLLSTLLDDSLTGSRQLPPGDSGLSKRHPTMPIALGSPASEEISPLSARHSSRDCSVDHGSQKNVIASEYSGAANLGNFGESAAEQAAKVAGVEESIPSTSPGNNQLPNNSHPGEDQTNIPRDFVHGDNSPPASLAASLPHVTEATVSGASNTSYAGTPDDKNQFTEVTVHDLEEQHGLRQYSGAADVDQKSQLSIAPDDSEDKEKESNMLYQLNLGESSSTSADAAKPHAAEDNGWLLADTNEATVKTPSSDGHFSVLDSDTLDQSLTPLVTDTVEIESVAPSEPHVQLPLANRCNDQQSLEDEKQSDLDGSDATGMSSPVDLLGMDATGPKSADYNGDDLSPKSSKSMSFEELSTRDNSGLPSASETIDDKAGSDSTRPSTSVKTTCPHTSDTLDATEPEADPHNNEDGPPESLNLVSFEEPPVSDNHGLQSGFGTVHDKANSDFTGPLISVETRRPHNSNDTVEETAATDVIEANILALTDTAT